MVSSGYEELDHTADIALRVWGEDFFALLRQSARGMYDLMGVKGDWKVRKKVEFIIEESNREIQLVDFLNEVLYLIEDDGTIVETFTFSSDERGLRVHGSGYEAKSIQRNIKAVTFHNLVVEETDFRLETRITFDV